MQDMNETNNTVIAADYELLCDAIELKYEILKFFNF